MAVLSLLILLLALVGAHLFVGAAVPAYALPAYAGVALAAGVGAFAPLSRRPPPKVLPLAAGLLFAAYIAWRAWASPVEYLARADLSAVTACLAVYLLCAVVLTSAKLRTALLWGLIGVGLAACVVGAIQFVRGDNWMPFGFVRTRYGIRASGFYICPNHLAGYLEMVAMFAFSLAIFGRFSATIRLLTGWAGCVLLAGIAITASRGGYLSTSCGLAVLLAMTLVLVGKRKPRLLVGVLIAVILASGTLWWAAPKLMRKQELIAKRLDKIVDTRDARFQMWEAAWNQFKQSPAIGTGSGSYLYYGRYFRPQGGYKEDPIHAHGDYLQLLGEYGVAGGVAALLLLLAHGVSGLSSAFGIQLKRLREGTLSSTSLAITVGALAALATQMAHAVVDFNLHIPANALVVAVVFGFLANAGIGKPRRRSDPEEEEAVTDEDPRRTEAKPQRPAVAPRRLLLVASGAAVLWIALPQIVPEWHHEIARVAMAEDRWTDAAESAKRGLKHDPTHAELHAILGEARLYRSADFPDGAIRTALIRGAISDLTEAIRLFPGDVWRWLALGQAHDALEQWTEARIAYEEVIRNAPTWADSYAYLALHFERQGLHAEAKATYAYAERVGHGNVARDGLARMRTATKPH